MEMSAEAMCRTEYTLNFTYYNLVYTDTVEGKDKALMDVH